MMWFLIGATVIFGAWMLTEATLVIGRAIGRWADRRVDAQFDAAGVRRSPYGPVQKYGTHQPYPFAVAFIDDLLEQALLEGIEQDERNEAEVEAFRADLDSWGESA